MRATIFLSLLFFGGFLVWRITERLSADALGLATGVILGILAGLPVALLLMAASRRRNCEDEEDYEPCQLQRHPHALPAQHQPPVIILSGMPNGYGQPQQQPYGQYGGIPQRALPGGSDIVDSRQFHVIGEEDEGVEEW